MKNRGLGPLGPSILDHKYVIYAFGSMLSCILCERQNFSESHKLKRFGARNQLRAARFVTASLIGCSLNAMEYVANNTLKMTKSNYEKSWSGTTGTINFGPQICDLCLWIDALLYSLWETKIFRKSQIEAHWCPKSVQSSAICDRFFYWM